MTDNIKAAMIRTLMLQIPSQTGAGLVVTSLMVSTAWPFNAPALVLAWGAAMLIAVFARWAVSRAFLRRERGDETLDHWAGLYALSMTGIGTMYGIAFFLFAHPGEPITIALCLAALYSVAAGSVPTAAYHFPAILGAVIPAFGAVLVKLLLAGSFVYIVLGIACALYGVTMIAYCRVQAGELRDGFRIRFENVELVEQLRLKTAAAEQANLAKSQFLAAASHDLRQPLYALGLFSSSLEELRLDSSGRDVVRRIQDSIGAMESSFEGLLDLSKLEAGIVKPRLEPVDVDALFDRVDQVFGPLAAERGLELRFRSNGEQVISDRVLLEQVVSNLVSNALRATAQGGVLVAARPREGALGIEIWDTGRGIAPDDLERIFDDYVQLDNPQRDRRRGLGLGLAIARRSLDLLDARIQVASRIGRGSRFAFAQPYADGGSAAKAGPELQFGVLRRGEAPLLVVEDDEDVRAALCDLLQRWGIDYRAAADAQEALEHLSSGQPFSLLITDQRLAGEMSGIDLIRAMRSRLPDPPPAIIVTGEVDPL
jgi:signal transduction histidine kinase